MSWNCNSVDIGPYRDLLGKNTRTQSCLTSEISIYDYQTTDLWGRDWVDVNKGMVS